MNEIRKQDVNEFSLIAVLIAFFLPPLGVAIKCGLGFTFLLNILLTCLGFIPGIVHAIYVILRK